MSEEWKETIAAQAAADFMGEVHRGESEGELGELEERSKALQLELTALDSHTGLQRRLEIYSELERIGSRIEELRSALPFMGTSDEELGQQVEERQLEAEDLKARASEAAATRPVLAAKLTKDAERAEWAMAEAQVEQKRRADVGALQMIAEKTASQQAANEAMEAEIRERQALGRGDPDAISRALDRRVEAARQAAEDNQQRRARARALVEGLPGYRSDEPEPTNVEEGAQ